MFQYPLSRGKLELFSLNSHKFRHNFRDTLSPMCPFSDGIEETEHFLLLCYAYTLIRCHLLDCVNSILQTNGSSNLSLQEMTKVL